jgi:NADH-quinone oxidoreductase subunit L
MMKTLIPLIPLFPLAGFLINGLLRKQLKGNLAGWLGSLAVLGAFVIALLTMISGWNNSSATDYDLFTWMQSGDFRIAFSLHIDHLSSLMMVIVTGVGLLIHIYSIGYMHGDRGYNRFFSFMNLFVFFMLILVMAGDYGMMFIGWEGVGFCSYLLIGFWYEKREYTAAAKKAFVMNRIGDLGFLLGLFLMVVLFGSLNFGKVFAGAAQLSAGSSAITAICLLLLVGAIGKSAQIPLYTWLPDAMAGPTPVSALIHAATMVTAGVYMIARSGLLYAMAPVAQTTVAVIGIVTALMAASVALFQNDIKKILAYSTVSQLGLMFLALGSGGSSSAIFHLSTHAFFKALLFLGAGSVIHALGGEQDIRRMGGLKKIISTTFLCFIAAALALSAVPPFAGFFSKDEIMMHAFQSNPTFWILSMLVSIMTAFYIFRLIYLVFYGKYRGNADLHAVHKTPRTMIFPMILLGVFAVIAGLPGLPALAGSTGGFEAYLAPVFQQAEVFVASGQYLPHTTEWILMAVGTIAVLLSIGVAWNRYVKKAGVPPEEVKGLAGLLQRNYRLDDIYQMIIVKPIQACGRFLHDIFDRWVIDGIVEGIGKVVMNSGKYARLAQNGIFSFYLYIMVIGIILLLVFNLLIA